MRTVHLGQIHVFINVHAKDNQIIHEPVLHACHLFCFFRLIMFYLFHEGDQFSKNKNFDKQIVDNADAAYGDCNSECDGGKAMYRINK